MHIDMKELYKILEKYPNHSITIRHTNEETLNIRASYTYSSSIPGVDTDEVRTSFAVSRTQTISICIPLTTIEASKIDLVLVEIEWAFEELRRFSKLGKDGDKES